MPTNITIHSYYNKKQDRGRRRKERRKRILIEESFCQSLIFESVTGQINFYSNSENIRLSVISILHISNAKDGHRSRRSVSKLIMEKSSRN